MEEAASKEELVPFRYEFLIMKAFLHLSDLQFHVWPSSPPLLRYTCLPRAVPFLFWPTTGFSNPKMYCGPRRSPHVCEPWTIAPKQPIPRLPSRQSAQICLVLTIFQESLICVQQAVEIRPKDPQGLYTMGRIYLKQNDLVAAGKCFESGLLLDPNHKGLQIVSKFVEKNLQKKKVWTYCPSPSKFLWHTVPLCFPDSPSSALCSNPPPALRAGLSHLPRTLSFLNGVDSLPPASAAAPRPCSFSFFVLPLEHLSNFLLLGPYNYGRCCQAIQHWNSKPYPHFPSFPGPFSNRFLLAYPPIFLALSTVVLPQKPKTQNPKILKT